MKKLRMLIALVLALTLLRSSAVAMEIARGYMYIDGKNARKVHLRQEPSTQSKSLGLFYTGTAVEPISSPSADWFEVRIGTETGYVSATYLSSTQPESKAPLAVVSNPNSNWAHLRQGASRQSQSIGRLYNDNTVYVLGEMSSGWSYVQNGEEKGFVVSSFLKTGTSTAASSGSVADTRRVITNPDLQVAGYTAQGEMIYCLKAPSNGQALYFVSQTKNPTIYWDDVNFDKRDDLVVTTSTGANNQYCMFFVSNGAGYTPVQISGLEYDLCNYQLYPKQQLVVSYANNGSAGACHEYAILRWNGSSLKVARRAVSDVLVDRYEQNGMSISATNSQMLKITVSDYTSGFFSGSVILETIVPLDSASTAFAHEQTTLWEGLK